MSVSRFGMAAALSLLFTASLDAQALRIGYIHVQEVLAQYPPAQAARDQLEGARNRFTLELQDLEADYRQAVDEYQQQQMSMTPEARQAREQEIQAKGMTFQNRDQEIAAQLQQLGADLLQPIMDDISAVIEEVRVDGGYALIVDADLNFILAADETLNLTQEVLTRLDEKEAPDGGR